jgi:pyruvate carboxylase
MGVAHRWPEIARTYAEVNQLFGDIVKVTPSSKVVGDMALFLFTRGIRPADVVNLAPGETPFPESVIDMLSGGLGWPEGGWPEQTWRAWCSARSAQAEARRSTTAAVAAPGKTCRRLAGSLRQAPRRLAKAQAASRATTNSTRT